MHIMSDEEIQSLEEKTIRFENPVSKNTIIRTLRQEPTKWDKFTLPFYRAFYKIKGLPYNLRQAFIRKHHIVKMPRLSRWNWCDTDHRLVHANFELLVQFVDNEKPFDWINWESDEGHQNAANVMRELYKWWKDYPRREKEVDDATHNWYVSSCASREDEKELFDRIHELEEKLHEETKANLHRLIDIKDYLWT